MAEDLSTYEYAAYHSILKALALSPASWETEEILTSLRMVLHITDEVHSDCRTRVNKDPEIVELREMQKQQRQSMRSGMQQQPSMTLSAGPGNLAPMHTLESGTGGPGAAAGHVMPPLMAQNSVTGASPHFGAPLANAPGPRDTLPLATGNVQETQGMTRSSAARPSGGANAWTQPPLSARQPSARTAAPLEPSSTFGGSTKNAKSPVGQKKTLTVSKTSKANARFAQAVPAGVDIMIDDLRGYVLERRNAEGVAWEQCVVVGCRKESTGQRLTVATGFGSAIERYTADVFLRKGKAGILWRFAMPVQRRTGDWEAALGRAAAAANAGGVAASIGGTTTHAPSASAAGGGGGGGGGAVAGLVGLGGSITGNMAPSAASMPVAVPTKAPSKKRKADVASVAEVPPFTADLRKKAIAAAQASQNPAELHAMVSSIQDKRKSLVDQLANLRVQDMLASASHKDALSKLRSELDSVRTRQAALKSDPGTNGRAPAAAAPAAEPAAADGAAAAGDGAAAPAAPVAAAEAAALPPAEAAAAAAATAAEPPAAAPATNPDASQPKTLSATHANSEATAVAPASDAAPSGHTAACSVPQGDAAAPAEQQARETAAPTSPSKPDHPSAKPSSNVEAQNPGHEQPQEPQATAGAPGEVAAMHTAAATAGAASADAVDAEPSPSTALPQTSGAGSDKAEDTTAAAEPADANAGASPPTAAATDAAVAAPVAEPGAHTADAAAAAAGSAAATGAPANNATAATQYAAETADPPASALQAAAAAATAPAVNEAGGGAEMCIDDVVEAQETADGDTQNLSKHSSPPPRPSPPPSAPTVATAAAKHVEPSPDDVQDSDMLDEKDCAAPSAAAAAADEDMKPPEDSVLDEPNAAEDAPLEAAEQGNVEGPKLDPKAREPTAGEAGQQTDTSPQGDVEMRDVSEAQLVTDASAKRHLSAGDDSAQRESGTPHMEEQGELQRNSRIEPAKLQSDCTPDQSADATQQQTGAAAAAAATAAEPVEPPCDPPSNPPTTDAAAAAVAPNAATEPPSEPRSAGGTGPAAAHSTENAPADTKNPPPLAATAPHADPTMSPVTAENVGDKTDGNAEGQSAMDSDVAADVAAESTGATAAADVTPATGVEKPHSAGLAAEGGKQGDEKASDIAAAAEKEADKSTNGDAAECKA